MSAAKKTTRTTRTKTDKKRVTVLLGGWSSERDVSLVSGQAIAQALAERGYKVATFDPPADPVAIAAGLSNPTPDVVFNALHGRGGEDGTIQAILDLLKLPYTHSGRVASTIAMDKPLTKALLAAVGVPSPEGRTLRAGELADGHPLKRPYILKPAAEGSSVGVAIVRKGANAAPAHESWTDETLLLAEPFIEGRELTVGVMGEVGKPARALCVTEIEYGAELFDYTAKYVAGHATHVLPADVPKKVAEAVMRYAVLAHETLGCGGVSRSDFRWDDREKGTNGLYFLEINTQPGFTPISLVPEQAQHVGISFGEIVEWLVETATWHG